MFLASVDRHFLQVFIICPMSLFSRIFSPDTRCVNKKLNKFALPVCQFAVCLSALRILRERAKFG